jgi:hypothetical protein
LRLWYYYGGESPNLVNIFTFPGTIPAFGQPDASIGMMEKIRAGLITATAGGTLDCLDQSNIDQLLNMGGNVPMGHGCEGTTHGPPDADHGGGAPAVASGEEAPADDDSGPAGSMPGFGFGN